jgi:hypothetical protein
MALSRNSVVAMMRGVAAGDLDRHQQRAEGEDDERQVQRHEGFELRTGARSRQRQKRAHVVGPAPRHHPGVERMDEAMKQQVAEQREQRHQPHRAADVALQRIAPIPG